MPVIYTPLSGADQPLTLAGLNTRYQEFEDYILGLGGADASSIDAVAGEGLADRAAAYLDLSDGKIYEMDADAAGPKASSIRGFIDGAVLATETATLVIAGTLNGFTSLTAWQAIYVGTTAGSITQTRPDPTSGASQVMVAEMGFAISTTEVFVAPKKIQYQKRDALADNETLTVQHHGDARGYRRDIWAYITEAAAGAEAEGYSDSNQDSDVGLRDSGPETYTSDLCTGGTPIGNMTAASGLAGAFDNNSGTGAGVTGVAGTIGYNFGVSNDKTIRQYTVTESTVHADANAPSDWTFEYSDNGSDWTAADTQSGLSFTNGETKTFQIANNGAHRYWRLNITDNVAGSGNMFVGEVEMMEAATFGDNDKLAQTFTLVSETDIASIGLWLKKVGSPTGTATVRIETVSGSNPTGTLVDANATGTFSESTLGTSYDEVLVSLADTVTLAAGTYAIVLSTDRSASETNYIEWGADGSTPSYSGGDMRSEASSSWSAESKDAVFSVYEPGASHPAKVSVDWWSSTYADVVNRYGDGTGADLTTKTTFKCLRDAGFDDITVVVELD